MTTPHPDPRTRLADARTGPARWVSLILAVLLGSLAGAASAAALAPVAGSGSSPRGDHVTALAAIEMARGGATGAVHHAVAGSPDGQRRRTDGVLTPPTMPASTAPPAPAPRTTPVLPEVVSHGDRGRPMVALTFDSNLTADMIRELDTGVVRRFVNDRVIDELRSMQVPATFFLAGLWVERYTDVARSLAGDSLFEIASHSYRHLGYTGKCYGLGVLPANQQADDVARSEAVLRTITDHPTPYFRFPGGCYDAAALRAIAGTGVQVIQYDVASGDAFARDPRGVVATTLGSVTNGSIVVMHVTGGNTAPVTDQALPAIVDGLRKRGFTLVRLSDLLAAGNAG